MKYLIYFRLLLIMLGLILLRPRFQLDMVDGNSDYIIAVRQ